MDYDLHSKVKGAVAIVWTAAAGASTVGSIIDTKGFESMEYFIVSGTITTGDFSLTIEDGDDAALADAAAVSSELIIGTSPTFAVTDDNVVKRVGVVSKKRYQRLTLVGANTPNGEFLAIAVQGQPQTMPVADQS